MVDNFELVKKFMITEPDVFYHTTVIRRGKDHPDLPAANKTINTWLVRGPMALDRLRPDIELLCKAYGARAYINIAPKSLDKLNKLIALHINQNLYNGNVVNPMKVLDHCVGELMSQDKKWIVDVDNLDHKARIEQHITDIWSRIHFRIDPWKIAEIPTKTGVHLITHPFNLEAFQLLEPGVDVHKNNPTCLYVP